jgi:dTDP-4-dehydrorhamnose 3,5-epimerase
MINGVIIKKIKKNEDARGWLGEFFREDEVEFRPAMGYVSVTKPGVVRGPHEHIRQSDGFVFVGPGRFDLYLWDHRDDSSTNGESMKFEVGENDPCLVIVPPGVIHGYKCVSDKDAYCINIPDKLYRGRGMQDEIDEVRWEEKEDSPYMIY